MTYARPTPSALEAAVEKLIEPIGSSSSEKSDRVVAHLWLIDVCVTIFDDLAKRGKAW